MQTAGSPALPAWPVAAAGIVALAVAMGVGRFAFTPLLPLMMRDGLLDVAGGAELAAANYLGYLLGALSAARVGRRPLRLLGVALAGVCGVTLGGAATLTHPQWLVLRGLAGVFSAWVLVGVSAWCLRELAARGAPRAGAWVYTGVGAGIAGTGLLAWVAGDWPSSRLWLALGLASVTAAWACAVLLRGSADPPRPSTPGPAAGAGRGRAGWVFCYGSFGFGYIVPATFLPALAREQVADPRLFGLAWPVFGLAATASVWLAARVLAERPRLQVWAGAQALMAVGTALPLASRSLTALVASAVAVGGTFMVATMAGLQLAREHEPTDPTALLSRMTSAFAAGQIAGPLLVRAVGPGTLAGLGGADLALAAATVLLAATAAWLWRAGPAREPAR